MGFVGKHNHLARSSSSSLRHGVQTQSRRTTIHPRIMAGRIWNPLQKQKEKDVLYRCHTRAFPKAKCTPVYSRQAHFAAFSQKEDRHPSPLQSDTGTQRKMGRQTKITISQKLAHSFFAVHDGTQYEKHHTNHPTTIGEIACPFNF